MQIERRRSERDRRESWRVPVVCAVRNTVAGRLSLGQAEDIGPGGITLRRPRDFPVLPRTPITLTFDLPGTRTTLDLDGLVVTDRRAGFFRRTGVRFIRLSAAQVALLGRLRRGAQSSRLSDAGGGTRPGHSLPASATAGAERR